VFGFIYQEKRPRFTALCLDRKIEWAFEMKFFNWLAHELKEIFPVTLFFFIGFGLIMLIVKLVLEDFSVQVGILSRAMLFSLIVGKVVLVLENVRLDELFPNLPRSGVIAIKTAFYGIGAVIAGTIEKIFEYWRSSGGLGEAMRAAWMHSSGSRFSAIVLSMTLLFATYFTFLELDRAMGKGEIYSLLFKRPRSHGVAGNSPQT
jgi:hypothetical protein